MNELSFILTNFLVKVYIFYFEYKLTHHLDEVSRRPDDELSSDILKKWGGGKDSHKYYSFVVE